MPLKHFIGDDKSIAKAFVDYIEYIYGGNCMIDDQDEEGAHFSMNVPGSLKREDFENDVQDFCEEYNCTFELVNQTPEAPSPQFFSENMKLMYPRAKNYEALAKNPQKLEKAKILFKQSWNQDFDPENEDDREDIVLLWNEYMEELSEWKPVEVKLHYGQPLKEDSEKKSIYLNENNKDKLKVGQVLEFPNGYYLDDGYWDNFVNSNWLDKDWLNKSKLDVITYLFNKKTNGVHNWFKDEDELRSELKSEGYEEKEIEKAIQNWPKNSSNKYYKGASNFELKPGVKAKIISINNDWIECLVDDTIPVGFPIVDGDSEEDQAKIIIKDEDPRLEIAKKIYNEQIDNGKLLSFEKAYKLSDPFISYIDSVFDSFSKEEYVNWLVDNDVITPEEYNVKSKEEVKDILRNKSNEEFINLAQDIADEWGGALQIYKLNTLQGLKEMLKEIIGDDDNEEDLEDPEVKDEPVYQMNGKLVNINNHRDVKENKNFPEVRGSRKEVAQKCKEYQEIWNIGRNDDHIWILTPVLVGSEVHDEESNKIKTEEDLFNAYANNWLDCDVDIDILHEAFERGLKGKDLPNSLYKEYTSKDMDYLESMNELGKAIRKNGLKKEIEEFLEDMN